MPGLTDEGREKLREAAKARWARARADGAPRPGSGLQELPDASGDAISARIEAQDRASADRVRAREGTILPLERIVVAEPGVGLPTRTGGVVGQRVDVIWDDPSQGDKRMLLWLDRENDEVVIEHPVSHCIERVPRARVVQMRRKGDHPEASRTQRPVGMVRSLV